MADNTKLMVEAEALQKEQGKGNWETFEKALKGSNAVYYKVVFANEGRLDRMQDLTKSYAEIYDKDYKLITKVPIFKTEGKKIRGATIYLMGLQVSNR